MIRARRLITLSASLALVTGALGLASAEAARADVGCPTAVAPTAGSPGVISTPAELQGLQADPSLWDDDWLMTGDIDMGGCTWTDRIGDNSRGIFSGAFDGGGHTISGLTVDVDDSYVGLFGYVEGASAADPAVIRNLTFTGDVSGDSYVGGLIGNLENLGEVVNVHTTGDVSATYDVAGGLIGYIRGYDDSIIDRSSASGDILVVEGPTAGGLIGEANYAVITESYATGSATATGDSYAGGLIGTANEVSVERSFATGDVSARREAAGLIGYLSSSTVTDAYASGRVTYSEDSSYAYVGGLAGYVYSSTISRSYSVGAVTGSEGVRAAGGFIGDLDGGSTSDSFWDTETSGWVTSAGGQGEPTAAMTTLATYASWSISQGFDPASTWGICPAVNSGYPFLTAFFTEDPCTASAARRTTAPPPVLQAVPLPSSGSCADVDDSALAYGSGVSGGWSRSWQPWVRPAGSEGATGGWACVRTLEYSLATDGWRVQGRT